MKIAVAEIDIAALQHNLTVVKQLAPNSKVLAMLKANAYGHGYLQMAEALTQADAFGVARLDEALKLRKAGINKPIVLLEGFFAASELPIIAEQNLETILHTPEQVDAFIAANLANPIRVWLKLDTGMHRIGVQPTVFLTLHQKLINSANVLGEPVLMTHFACADEQNHPLNNQQLDLFTELTKGLKGERSLANSAAIMSMTQTHQDWIRPGLMMYGASAMAATTAQEYDLRPVMTLKTSVIAIRSVKQGESVGYGAAWQAPKDTQLAVVAMGYGDGYPRNAQNGTPVLINGNEYPLAGRVSMDMLTVDIGLEHNINIGDEVTLWGKGLPIECIAQHANSISYELLCGVTGRVKKQFN